MFLGKNIVLFLLLLSPLVEAHCAYEDWAMRVMDKMDKRISLNVAKVVVTAYLSLGIAGATSLAECSAKEKMVGSSIFGLLIVLANLVRDDACRFQQSLVKGAAGACLLVTWLAIPELLLGLLDSDDE